jgi:hypothetical protein
VLEILATKGAHASGAGSKNASLDGSRKRYPLCLLPGWRGNGRRSRPDCSVTAAADANL